MWKLQFLVLISCLCSVCGNMGGMGMTSFEDEDPYYGRSVKVVDKQKEARNKLRGSSSSSSYSSSSASASSSSSSRSSFESISGVEQGTDVDSTELFSERSFLTEPGKKRPNRRVQRPSSDTAGVTRPSRRIQCTDCLVNGKQYKGHSRFEYREGCLHHRCICHCDGSYNCPKGSVTDMCERENKENPNCQSCQVQNKDIRGNSYFDMKDGCTLFKNCICRCDGSYSCSPQRAENLCPQVTDEEIEIPTIPTYKSTVQPPTTIKPVEESPSCQKCFAHGRYQNGNSRFTHVDDCIEYDCDCLCNGEWVCPPERAQNICDFDDEQPPTCKECEVNGEFFEGDTKFKQTTGCTEYTCNCRCDGTYDCPPSTAKNICDDEGNAACSRCRISDIESYAGESNFTLQKGCIHYQCRCNCDGAWNCPGKDARNICKGEQIGGCRNCEISDKEYYPGDSNFTITKGCIGYSCRCNCDGSWNCPGEDARDTCKGEVVGGCKSCILSDREYYPGETDFEMKRGCILYQCHCDCKGGWNCPGYKAKDICRDPSAESTDERGLCTRCELSNGEIHEPYSEFKMERGCYEYNCKCNCDGNYECPQTNVTNICDVSPDSSEEFRQQQERELQRQRLLQQQKMREQQQREALERQRRREEAIRKYKVDSGKRRTRTDRISEDRTRIRQNTRRDRFQITGQKTTTTNSQSNRKQTDRDTTRPCRTCSFAGKTHPGDTKFEYRRGCYSYPCSCDCNGRWSCDRNNVSYICSNQQSSVDQRVQTNNQRHVTPTYHVQSGGTSRNTTYTSYSSRTGSTSTRGRVRPNNRYSFAQTNVQGRESDRSVSYPRRTSQNSGVSDTKTTYTTSQERDQLSNRNTFNAYGQLNGNDFGTRRTHYTQTNYQYPIRTETRYTVQTGESLTPPYNRQVFPPLPLPHLTGANGNYPVSRKLIFPSTTNSGSQQSHYSSYNLPIRSNTVYSAVSVDYPPAVDSTVSSDSCQKCLADSKYYSVNDVFDMNRNCVIYKCRCMCNGNYRCAITPNPQCSVSSVQENCGNCHVDGLIYPGDMGFQQRKGCFEYTCQCHCNGNYTCPDEKKVNLCPSNGPPLPNIQATQGNCATCDIEGQSYKGNEMFKIYKQCLVYNCFCDCNGGWKCSADHAPGCHSSKETVTVGYPELRASDQCTDCFVGDQYHNAGASFSLTEGCLKYSCQCYCNGTWNCPLQQPALVCDARTIQRKQDSCQSCHVRGTVYPVDATFIVREGCSQHTCTCNCDGSWRCPLNTTIDICQPINNTPENPKGCKSCTVKGKNYLSESKFKFLEGCNQYSCECFCDGTWSCPAKKIKNICGNPDYRIDGCKECHVKNIMYPGGRPFTYKDGCNQYNCMCDCSGNWNCPAERTVNLCKNTGSVSSQCKPCLIESKVITSGTPFNLRKGCKEYLCDCGCDGSWTCPEDRSINTCKLEGTPGFSSTETVTKGCTIGNKTYYRRLFGYIEDCIQYTCVCFDNGAWQCPANKSKRVC